jgi:hypothetical protein
MLPQLEYGNIGVFTPFILYKFDPTKKAMVATSCIISIIFY